jgi:di/tricarboxylate transporter
MSNLTSSVAATYSPSWRSSHLVALSIMAGALLLAFFPPAGLSPNQSLAAAVVVGTMGLWATGVVAESLTALMFFTVAMLGRIAPADVVFSGLVSSAFWLVFSGLILGAAIRRSGLGDRIAASLARLLGETYGAALVGAVMFGLIMAVLMPSAMGRIVLMLPILTALAEHLGHRPSSRAHTGLVLGGLFGTILPSMAILPANVPNNVLAGIVESTFGKPLAFGDYLLVHFPVLGALKTLMLIGVLLSLYGGSAGKAAAASMVEPGVKPVGVALPMQAGERRLAIVLAIALGMWATDGIHHISPAWIGMAAAVFCLLPAADLLPPKALQSINLEPVFYVGGIVSLGTLVVHTGLSHRLAEWALHVLPLHPGAPASNFAILSGLSAVVGLLTTLPGVPAVVTPLTTNLAAASGLSDATVIMTQVVGFSTVILPYQAPPLVMALQISDLPRREVVRMCLITAGLTVVLLWPIDFLWLAFLGRI